LTRSAFARPLGNHLRRGALMPDTSGVPTPTTRAATVRDVLQALLVRLQELPLDLMQHDLAERTRADAIGVAIEHLQQAIDALELASRE
jgi:hypothetical protein